LVSGDSNGLIVSVQQRVCRFPDGTKILDFDIHQWLLDSIVRDFRRRALRKVGCAALELVLVKKRNREWTDEDLNRLAAIVAAGGTPARASAALGRSIASCKIQACRMDTPFVPLHIRRREILAKCAAAERALVR
jgi:hypothetical protein